MQSTRISSSVKVAIPFLLCACTQHIDTRQENVKVCVAVKFIDNQTKETQISQYELTLRKDINWNIIE